MSPGRLIGWSALAWTISFVLLGIASSPPAAPLLETNLIVEVLAHLLGPLLLAALLSGWISERSRLERRIAPLLGAGVAFLIALAAELAQLRLPERSVEILDIGLSFVGAVAGALPYIGVERSRVEASRTRERAAVTLNVIAALAVAVTVVTLVTQPTVRHVCLGQTTPEPVAGPSPPLGAERTSEGVVVEYRFTEGFGTQTEPWTSGVPALELTLHDGAEWLDTGGGVTFGSATAVARSVAPATTLVDAMLGSGRFTIEAWVTPDRLQTGPARIVSISDSPAFEDIDLHIGQEGTCLSHRIRFGSVVEWVLVEGVFADQARRHLVVTFTDGVTRTYVDGALIDVHDALDDTPHGWNPGHHLLVGNEETRNRVFLGDVFLVALYDRPLEGGEVSANFLAGHRSGP